MGAPTRAPATVGATGQWVSFLHRWPESVCALAQAKGHREPGHLIEKSYSWPKVDNLDYLPLVLPLTWITPPLKLELAANSVTFQL